MAYSEKLAARIRLALSDLNVEEKKMFGSIAFMVNGKMCITAGKDRIMCRIDPAIHGDLINEKGVKAVIMKGRNLNGYIHVREDVIQSKKELQRWIELVLDYNAVAKPAKKKSN